MDIKNILYNHEKKKSKYKKQWKGFVVSNSAIDRIKYLMSIYVDILGIRIDIVRSGCAGFIYKMSKVFCVLKDDLIYNYKFGVRLFVDLNIMYFIDGTEIDYIRVDLNNVFKFVNPKANYVCGCGKSFNLVDLYE